jgi:hypothetical protein
MRLPHAIAATLAALTMVVAPAARSLAASKRPPADPWVKLEATAPDRLLKVKAGARRALQVAVKPGDSPTRSGERTEMVYDQASSLGYEGRTVTYEWSTRFPSGFGYVDGQTWNIFAQFHETAADGCHPNLALQINAKKSPPVLRLQTRGGALDPATCDAQLSPSWDFAPLQFDRWYDFTLRVRWSADPTVGFVELSVNGAPVVTRKSTPTLYPGQGVYFKQGFYRAPSAFDSVLFHTPLVVSEPAAVSRRR